MIGQFFNRIAGSPGIGIHGGNDKSGQGQCPDRHTDALGNTQVLTGNIGKSGREGSPGISYNTGNKVVIAELSGDQTDGGNTQHGLAFGPKTHYAESVLFIAELTGGYAGRHHAVGGIYSSAGDCPHNCRPQKAPGCFPADKGRKDELGHTNQKSYRY